VGVARRAPPPRPPTTPSLPLHLELFTSLTRARAGTRVLLTGTPLQNDARELFHLLNFLLPGVFGDAGEWGTWFGAAEAAARGRGAAARGGARGAASAAEAALLSQEERLLVTARLHSVLRPFVLRRRKADVAADLPPLVRATLAVPPTPYQAGLTRLLLTDGAAAAAGIQNALCEARAIANAPTTARLHPPSAASLLPRHPLPVDVRLSGKVDVFDRLVLKLAAGGHKTLAFSTSVVTLETVLAPLLGKREEDRVGRGGWEAGGAARGAAGGSARARARRHPSSPLLPSRPPLPPPPPLQSFAAFPTT